MARDTVFICDVDVSDKLVVEPRADERGRAVLAMTRRSCVTGDRIITVLITRRETQRLIRTLSRICAKKGKGKRK